MAQITGLTAGSPPAADAGVLHGRFLVLRLRCANAKMPSVFHFHPIHNCGITLHDKDLCCGQIWRRDGCQ